MALRLMIRTGHITPSHPPTLADHIDHQIDRLLALRELAANERRTPDRTEQLLDAVAETGHILVRVARG